MVVAKLKAARDRKKAETGKCEGRKSYAEANPELVALARSLSAEHPTTTPGLWASIYMRLSLREISAELAAHGYRTAHGIAYSASAVKAMLEHSA